MYCLQVSGSGDTGEREDLHSAICMCLTELSLTARRLAHKCDGICKVSPKVHMYVCPWTHPLPSCALVKVTCFCMHYSVVC